MVAPGERDDPAFGMDDGGQLSDQSRLADPGRSGHRHERTGSGSGRVHSSRNRANSSARPAIVLAPASSAAGRVFLGTEHVDQTEQLTVVVGEDRRLERS